MTVVELLLVIAAVLTGLAAFGVRSPIHLGWAGITVYLVALVLR